MNRASQSESSSSSAASFTCSESSSCSSISSTSISSLSENEGGRLPALNKERKKSKALKLMMLTQSSTGSADRGHQQESPRTASDIKDLAPRSGVLKLKMYKKLLKNSLISSKEYEMFLKKKQDKKMKLKDDLKSTLISWSDLVLRK